MHTLERQREQLQAAGIAAFPPPSLDWLSAPLTHLGLPRRFALFIPGASVKRPGKRWPAHNFAALAAALPVPVVIVGGQAERGIAREIRAGAPAVLDLTARTSLFELAALARLADFTVGNDTGPTHLAAATGCPTLALFGGASDPVLCAPRGAGATVLRHLPLRDLGVGEVLAALQALLPVDADR